MRSRRGKKFTVRICDAAISGKGIEMPNVLEALRSAGISCPMGNGNIKDTGSPEVLKELGQRYLAKSSMVPGDLVTWKKGLRDSRFPEYGKPVVVIEIVPGQRRPLEGDASGNHCGRD